MPSIRLLKFGGMRPAVESRYLNEPFAIDARNTFLLDGRLTPFAEPADTGVSAVPGATALLLAPGYGGDPWLVTAAGASSLVPIHGTVLCPDGGAVAAFFPDGTPPQIITQAGDVDPLVPVAPTSPVVPTRWAPDEDVGSNTGPDARSWTYTWIYEGGVESRPAPPSATVTTTDGTWWTLDLPAAPADVIGCRIYRYTSGLGNVMGTDKVPTATGYQLLVDIERAVSGFPAVFIDNIPQREIDGTPLQTLFDAGPPLMDQVVAMELGYLVGFKGNQLYFSERGMPHAWPVKYRMVFPHRIRGIAVFQNVVYIGTNGFPYVVEIAPPTGDQTDMTWRTTEIQQHLPLIGDEAITATDYGAAYASELGMVTLTGRTAQLLTRGRIDERVWEQTYAPLRVVWHKGRLFCSGGPIGGFVLSWQGSDGLDVGDVVAIDWVPFLAHGGTDGRLYYVGASGDILAWNEGVVPMGYRWVSRRIVGPGFMKFAAAKVEGDFSGGAGVTCRIYSDDTLYHTEVLTGSATFRLPDAPRGIEWRVELEGTARIHEFHMATSRKELIET